MNNSKKPPIIDYIALLFSLISLIVSAISLYQSDTANKIARENNDINRTDKQPLFEMNTTNDRTTYIIHNTRGDISGVSIDLFPIYVVHIINESGNFEYKVNALRYFYPNKPKYNKKTKSFKFQNSQKYEALIRLIENKLKNYKIQSAIKGYLKISYVDFYGYACEKYFCFDNFDLFQEIRIDDFNEEYRNASDSFNSYTKWMDAGSELNHSKYDINALAETVVDDIIKEYSLNQDI